MRSASNKGGRRTAGLRIAAAGLLALAASQAGAATATLCVEPYTMNLPGTANVPMWGYRAVNAASECPAVTAPAARVSAATPAITVPAGDTTLTVTLINRLNVPTSLVIPAQGLPGGVGGAVMAPDVFGATTCTPNPAAAPTAPAHPQNCRVRSFTGETAPGGTRTYTFSNLRAGTYLYQSGTHPQVQVQMGLAGMLRVLSAAPAGYDYDAGVLLSEIDPLMHTAIATSLGTAGNEAAWRGQSTLNYAPRYFLVNGRVFEGLDSAGAAATDVPVAAAPGSRIGLRIANAGLQSRTLMLTSGVWRLLNEDGYAYPAPREQATALVPAGKTTDAVIDAVTNTDGSVNRSIAFFDRRAGTDNFDGTMLGGQVARLAIANAGPAPNRAPVVNAGADQTVATPGATLTGIVTDDAKLTATPILTWSLVSGPGAVTFGSAGSASTTVTLGPVGAYTLRLSAYDGEFTTTDDVVVSHNAPPTVNAGADRTVTVNQVTLAGTVTDDGAGPVTTTWSRVSGPGTATFATPSAATTGVTFSALGAYTLRFTATDGPYVVSDDVAVTVAAGKHVGDVDQSGVRLVPSSPNWNATVTIRIENALHAPVNNATVTGNWVSGGVTVGTSSCVTGSLLQPAGTCGVLRTGISNALASIVFVVTGVTGANAQGAYNAANNHDPDTGAQASNGTTITVLRP